MKTLSFFRRHKIGGFSLAESVVSLGIGTVAIVGGMTLSQHEMKLVKSVRQTNAASHALEERIEQLRLVNWRQMTDAQHLMSFYFPKRPASGSALPGLTERVTVTAYPDPSVCTPLVIQTNEAGTPTVINAGSGFDTQRLARVNVQVKWSGSEGKVRVRELASIISNAGINATSLPVFGSDSSNSTSTSSTTTGTATGTTTGTTDTTTGTTSTTTGTTTGTTSTTTTSTSTGTTTSNNGNGNGRGNAGGQSGKK